MAPRTKWLILAFALVGLGFAVASSWVHYKLLTDPTYVTPCDINATFNCSQVYLSRFGAVWGIPVALGGVIWFGLAALLAAFADTSKERSLAASYLFAWSIIGLATILYLGYASFFVLGTGCVLCMGTYVCVLAIFVLSVLSKRVPTASLIGRVAGDIGSALARPAALVAGLLFLVASVSLVAFFPTEGSVATRATAAPAASEANDFASAWVQQPRVDLGIPAEGAQVIIVKFNDYECPGCRQAELAYRPIIQKLSTAHPGAIKYVVKDWPWNSTCNFNSNGTIRGHEASCESAAAMRMAKDRGKTTEMEEWIYANQGKTTQALREAAAKILGVTDFDKEYALKLPEIRRDVADGGVLRIESTPTYFINGVRLPGLIATEYFELAINLELNRAS